MIAGLRPATVADATRVAALVDRCYGHYVARIGQKPYPMTVDYAEALEQMRGYVVERDRRIVGLLLLEEVRDHMMVENVAVDPGQQGSGMGRQLMELAETEALARGIVELRLYTHQMMTENQAIYRRGAEGWHTDGAYDFPIDCNRNAALEHARRAAGQVEHAHVYPALGDQVLDSLGRPAEGRRRMGLFAGNSYRAELGAVQTLQHHHVAARIDDGDDHVPTVLLRLRLGRRHGLLRLIVGYRCAIRQGRLGTDMGGAEQRQAGQQACKDLMDFHGISSCCLGGCGAYSINQFARGCTIRHTFSCQ